MNLHYFVSFYKLTFNAFSTRLGASQEPGASSSPCHFDNDLGEIADVRMGDGVEIQDMGQGAKGCNKDLLVI